MVEVNQLACAGNREIVRVSSAPAASRVGFALVMAASREVCARFGPGLWPGPRRQARGYGSVIHPVSGRWPLS